MGLFFSVAWEISRQHCAHCSPNFVFSPSLPPPSLFPFNRRTWLRQTGRAASAVNGFIHNYRHRQEAARAVVAVWGEGFGEGVMGGGSIFCQSAGFEAERSHVWAALRWLWATGGHWCWRPCQWITSSFFCEWERPDQSERGRGILSRAPRLWNRPTLRRWRVCVWNAQQFAAV